MTVRTTAALLTLSLAAASAADAQARGNRGAAAAKPAANACDIQSAGSTQVTNAYAALGRYNEAQDDAAKRTALTEAVKQLSGAPANPASATARQWVLGQTLVAWSLIDGQALAGPRSSYGYTTDGAAEIQILAAADSALDAVVAAAPGCKDQVDNMRRLAYVTAANRAVAAFNEGKTEEAEAIANQSVVIYDENAPTYHLLGNVAIKKQDWAMADSLLGRAAEASKADSSLASLRLNALESQAAVLNNLVATSEGDAQRRYATKQAGVYRELITLQPDNGALQSGLAQALSMSGDTAAVSGIYSQMLANPSGYTASQLLDAGIGAANSERYTDAVALLEAGLAQNPYYRDGLFALAFGYSTQNDFPKMAAAATRLVAVDPSNPDNYNLLAQAYQGILSTNPPRDVQRAYLDSLQKAMATMEKMPVKVSFTDFQAPSAEQRVLNGTIENRGTAAADFVLNVEFLDARGAVVATKQETVAGVAPGGSKPFSITGQGQGIVAFRYAPVAAPGGAPARD